MTDSGRREILKEKFFSKISSYISDVAERVDLDPYIPVLELLRWLFVPSIDHRILALLEHFIYKEEVSSCDESPETFLRYMDAWLEASTKLNQLLRPDGISRIFVDSILLGNRIEHIGRQLDNLGAESPQFNWADTCERLRNVDYCADRYQSTRCPNRSETAAKRSEIAEAPRQSRKRKATYEEIPAGPTDISMEDQTEASSEGTKRGRHESRSDKLRLRVTEQHPPNNEGCSRRRTDYSRLPCDCRALKEKLFKRDGSAHSGNFDERLKNVCNCLNNALERMDDEAVNDAALSCDVRENYARFRLARIKPKLCMFAARLALRRQREKDKRRENEVSSGASATLSEKDCGNTSSDNVCDKSVNSGVEAGCSMRFLWNPSRHCFATSSVDDDASADENNICSPTHGGKEDSEDLNFSSRDHETQSTDGSDCKCKSQKNMSSGKNCPCSYEQIPKKSAITSPRMNDTRRCHFQQEYEEAGLMANDFQEKVAVQLKDAQITTDEIDEPIELTNIYVNEISVCCCGQRYDAVEDIGVNTECNRIETSTNTDGCKLEEISTQVFFREIQVCTCHKNIDQELEIENVKLENQEHDVPEECNKQTSISEKFKLIEIDNRMAKQNTRTKETPFDDIIQQLKESPCRSSIFTDMMKLKINEIVDLNEKIRKKVTMIKDNTDVCSVSVQTLIKQKSCDGVNAKIQVKTSVISFKSKISGKTCTTKSSLQSCAKLGESCKSIFHSMKVCKAPECGYNNLEDNSCALKKSILAEVSASLEIPALQKFKTDVIYQCSKMSQSSTSLIDTYLRSNISNIEEIFICDSSESRNENSNIRCTCRCTKKSDFLNFLSEHLTRETFEKFKRILRFILRKLIEKAKMLNELRKSRKRSECHCSYCCRNESYSSIYGEECSETCSYEKNSLAPTRRLAGGGDVDISRKSSRECKPAKFTRSTLVCRDLENASGQRRYRRRHRRKKLDYEVDKFADSGNGLRRCRTQVFASRRKDSRAACRDSLAFIY